MTVRFIVAACALSLSMPAAAQTGVAAPVDPRLADVIARLDMRSFPNSIGPRRQPDKVTLADYGVTLVEAGDDGWVHVWAPDRSWVRSFRLLETGPDGPTVCFVDDAQGGATYFARRAYRLSEADGGYLQATPVEREDCPTFPVN
jgi:hypothetical protein